MVLVGWGFHDRASLAAQMMKDLPAVQETWVQSRGQEDPPEKGMAAHSRSLVWSIHGQRSLADSSPWGHKYLDMTEQLNLTFHDKV